MELCSDDHQEICFEGRSCPLCDAISEKDKEILSLEEQIEDLTDKLEAL